MWISYIAQRSISESGALVMTDACLSSAVKPFLHRFAIERTGGRDIEGYYSEIERMWVVSTSDGVRPIIEVANEHLELLTKTAAGQEQDDDRNFGALELATKSDTGQESDDMAIASALVLELSTKTEAQLEGDDTRKDACAFM